MRHAESCSRCRRPSRSSFACPKANLSVTGSQPGASTWTCAGGAFGAGSSGASPWRCPARSWASSSEIAIARAQLHAEDRFFRQSSELKGGAILPLHGEGFSLSRAGDHLHAIPRPRFNEQVALHRELISLDVLEHLGMADVDETHSDHVQAGRKRCSGQAGTAQPILKLGALEAQELLAVELVGGGDQREGAAHPVEVLDVQGQLGLYAVVGRALRRRVENDRERREEQKASRTEEMAPRCQVDQSMG